MGYKVTNRNPPDAAILWPRETESLTEFPLIAPKKMISIGTVSEHRGSFNDPHHDVMQRTCSVDSKSPWHETPLPLPTIAGRLYNLTAYPLLQQQPVFSVETHANRGVPIPHEPRDLYDLWHLTGEGLVSTADLTDAVTAKAEFRNRTITDAKGVFQRKEARLKKLWTVRLSAQMAELPEFDEVYRAVTRELRQVGLLNQT